MTRLTVRHTRNRMAQSEDLLNIDLQALPRQLLKNIRPCVEATSLAFGHEEVVHRKHVLGVHRFGRYGDGVDVGLLMYRKQVVCHVCDWFHHNRHVRVALHDADRDGHDFHVHSLRHYLDTQNLGHEFHVQKFGHNFHVRKFGHKF